MITDPIPRAAAARTAYSKSDKLLLIELPEQSLLRPLADGIEAALTDEKKADLQRACAAFAAEIARAHGVAAPPIKVLGVRPHRVEEGRCTFEKFGDYDLGSSEIRLWTKTVMRRQVSAFGTFFATLCHEVCHHLDVVRLGFEDTPHTRGFYERAGLLYHHARQTPKKTLVWVSMPGGRYRIDWQQTMRAGK